jgi:SAM-dependent methyltransferase
VSTPDAYAAYFESPAHWGRTYETVTPGERLRIDTLVELLPADAEPVLDAGCGDGVVTNVLFDGGVNVTGVDISEAALGHVRAPTVRGSVDELPFADRSFACVVAANVLEHLPAGMFERTLAELERVADRYVLVSTPHEEDLVLAQTRCDRCETSFHAAWHVRSVRVQDFERWLPAFRLRELRLTGETVRRRSRTLQRLAQTLGNVWLPSREAVCPTCGYRLDPPRPNRLVRVANGAIQRAIGLAGGERPTQLVALFDRR